MGEINGILGEEEVAATACSKMAVVVVVMFVIF